EWEATFGAWEVEGKEGNKPTKPSRPKTVSVENISLPTLPNGWAWEHIGNLNAEIFDGPFGSNLKTSDYVNDGVRVIRLENIGYLEFIEEKRSYISEEKYETVKKHTIGAG